MVFYTRRKGWLREHINHILWDFLNWYDDMELEDPNRKITKHKVCVLDYKTIKKTTMKISIITICLNDLQGLKKTRDSILCQTWKDWEWIVIDGGSSDGTKEFLQDHQEEMSYWCSEKDKGVYDAQNKGAQKATGNYCIFMNANDKFHDEHVLEIMVNSHPTADVVYGNWIQVFEDGKKGERFSPKDMSFFFLIADNICHQAMFVKTALIQKSPYNTSYRIFGDWEKWLSFKLENRTFHYIDYFVCDFALDGISYYDTEGCNKEYERMLTELLGKERMPMAKYIRKQREELERLNPANYEKNIKRLSKKLTRKRRLILVLYAIIAVLLICLFLAL